MHAERLLLETDPSGNLKRMPKLPPNKRLEVIILVLDDVSDQPAPRRSPHPDIAGKTTIVGNIIDTVPETDWNLAK